MDDSTRVSQPPDADNEIDLARLLLAWWPYRKSTVLISIGVFLVATLVIVFVVANRYEAEVVFLPPSLKDTSSVMMFDMGEDISRSKGLGGLLRSSSSPVMEIIESLGLRLAVVHTLELVDRFGAEDEQDAAKRLGARLTIKEKDSGAVSIKVWDTAPAQAKRIVEAFVEETRQRVERVINAKMEHVSGFLEVRANAADAGLEAALKAWQTFQEGASILEVQNTAESLNSVVARLSASRLEALAELKALETVHGEQNSIIIVKRTYIRELEKHINTLRGVTEQQTDVSDGSSVAGRDTASTSSALPTGSVLPRFAAAEQRFRLDIESQAKIAGLIKSKLELARLSLIRHQQLMEILDSPVEPKRPKKRKAMLIVLAVFLSLMAGFGQAIVRVLWSGLRRRIREEQDAEQDVSAAEQKHVGGRLSRVE